MPPRPAPTKWTAKLVRQHTAYMAYLKSEGTEPNEAIWASMDWKFERGLSDKPRPKRRQELEPKSKTSFPRKLDIDQLADWTNEQPWYVQLLMWQFVLSPLVVIRLVIVFFGAGILLYFASGGGAP
jgi:hypothetical protein